MNELFKINYESDSPRVGARELHEFLEIGSEFRHWFPRMCEYGFIEIQDYTPVIFDHPQNKQPTTDYAITIDMAKEICMLQRNDKGKQARQCFIQLESAWNSPEKIMARALQYAQKQITHLTLENTQQKQMIGELQPKATYCERILANKGLVTVTQIAKDYGKSAKWMNAKLHELGVQFKQSGQWLLYAAFHDKGYTHSRTVEITHSNGTPDVVMETKWTQKGRLFLYELLKVEGVLPTIEQD